MRLVVADPSALIVTFDEAVSALRLEGLDESPDLIEGMLAAAIAHLDGSAGWLGRNLSARQVDLYCSAADRIDGELRLPLGPVSTVALVEHRDPMTGEWTVIDPGIYEVLGDTVGPAWRQHWPICAARGEAIHVQYEAGYVTLPKPIRSAILLMTGDLYANRETVETGVRAAAVSVPMSTTVENLLTPFRLYC